MRRVGKGKHKKAEKSDLVEVFSLYETLSMRNSSLRTCNARIPNTILYRSGMPVAWYFSTADGYIEKAMPGALRKDLIEEAFLEGHAQRRGNVVAVQITKELSGNDDLRFGFLDRGQFRTFLRFPGPTTCILQQFVEPRGERNTVVRVIWTPHLTICEKRVNIYAYEDVNTATGHDRCVTFDGTDYLSIQSDITHKPLLTRLSRHCKEIGDHVKSVCHAIADRMNIAVDFPCHVRLMMLHFKFDKSDLLFFTYASRLNMTPFYAKLAFELPTLSAEDSLVNTINRLKRDGTRMHMHVGNNLSRSIGMETLGGEDEISVFAAWVCPCCRKVMEDKRSLKYAVSYEIIMNGFEKRMKKKKKRKSRKVPTVASNCSPSKDGMLCVSREPPLVSPFPMARMNDSGRGRVPFVRQLTTVLDRRVRGLFGDPRKLVDQRREASILATLIPSVLRRCDEELAAVETISTWNLIKRSPEFLKRQAKVCETCCLKYHDRKFGKLIEIQRKTNPLAYRYKKHKKNSLTVPIGFRCSPPSRIWMDKYYGTDPVHENSVDEDLSPVNDQLSSSLPADLHEEFRSRSTSPTKNAEDSRGSTVYSSMDSSTSGQSSKYKERKKYREMIRVPLLKELSRYGVEHVGKGKKKKNRKKQRKAFDQYKY